MGDKRYGVEVTGICKICQAEGKTEMHHIISQSQIKRIKRPDLLTNAGNIIEICVPCHDLTDSSVYRRWYKSKKPKLKRSREQVRKRREKKRLKKGLFQCEGNVKSGRQCEVSVKKEGQYCGYHKRQGYKKRKLAQDRTKLKIEEE